MPMGSTTRHGSFTLALRGLVLAAAALLPFGLDAQVVVNEILASNAGVNRDEDGDSSDWVELYNTGGAAVDLDGYALSDDPSDPEKWVFPTATLGPEEYLLVWCSGKDRTRIAEDRINDPAADIPFSATFVSRDAEWRYLTGMPLDDGPPPQWHLPEFDDAGWKSGKPGFGFGDGDDVTVLPEGIGAVFLRHVFTLEPGRDPSSLVLQARYDDGFVAYLNGTRVLSANFPEDEEPVFSSLATRSHEARAAARFDISGHRDLLRPGENLLAVALLNRHVTSPDLSLIPELGTIPPVFHTSFRLDADGEHVVLSASGGAPLEAIAFPRQFRDQSWGRSPDGEGEFLYHLEPSPRAENAGKASPDPLVVADTTFSVDRGFFDEPFLVEIMTATEGAEIRYTLDGSEPTEEHGLLYGGPVHVSDTTTLRAAAFRAGLRATNVDAQTYIFLETPDGGGVINQPRRPPGFPLTWQGSSGSRAADYEMDPRITTDTTSRYYDPGVKEGLLSLPTLSLVMDLGDLFDPRRGIYANPRGEGRRWERPVSVEFFSPDGDGGFQVNAGLRIQGNASRSLNRPKHNMRLLFKTIYGPGKLRYPLFEDSPVEEFDTIVLRGGNGDSWFHPRSIQQTRAQYIRDQWHRDSQIAMGRLTAHQLYAHLYINGLYWGLYHIFERPNASFLASYLGGEEEEYDAFNVGEIVDGDLRAWNEMVRIVRAGVRTPEDLARVREYLDIPNMIDFLLINFYSGNVDWDHRNWYGGGPRAPGAGGFKFFCWDAERTFWTFSENRVSLNNAGRPTGLNQRLRQNAEYRILFADHVQRHFFNGGALTPEAVDARWMARAEEIETALSAEAARWGDNKRPRAPYTRDVEWARELRSLRGTWFPRRTGLVLRQIQSLGLYPRTPAPSFSQHGGRVAAGFELAITAPSGTVHYTLDGTDPRLPGGAVAPGTLVATAEPVVLDESVIVSARAREGGDWSALTEATFVVEGAFPLRITEIFYNPPAMPGDVLDPDEFEFVELKNIGEEVLDLSGARLDDGIRFGFSDSPITRLRPGEFVLVVENVEAFTASADMDGLFIAGEYDGRLSNAGERIVLLDPLGERVLAVEFSDAWYPATDGEGHSLVLADDRTPVGEMSEKSSWRPSRVAGGSPGADDPPEIAGGGQIPGDMNQDSRLNISDAVGLLRFLFPSGEDPGPTELPCGDGTLGDEANRTLLDTNGDGAVRMADAVSLLNYLFLAGEPPALGRDCVGIAGCPDRCSTAEP